MLNDLLGNNNSRRDDPSEIELISRILPFSELPFNVPPRNALGRARELWTASSQDEKLAAEWLSYAEMFEAKFSVSLQELLSVVMQIYFTVIGFDPSDDQSWRSKLIINREEYFQKCILSSQTVCGILSLISATPSRLATLMFHSARQSDALDFTIVRRFPLIEVEKGIYCCYDSRFLLTTLTDGIYWLLDSCVPLAKREDFRSFFGRIYESYIRRILARKFNPSSVLFPKLIFSPQFENSSDEVCDVIIDTSEQLFLLELKASLLTTRAKYSGDHECLRKDLQDKFARPSGSRRKKGGQGSKGIFQLSSSIRRLALGCKVGYQDFDIRSYKVVTPIMVVYDEALSAPGIDRYLGQLLNASLTDLPMGFAKVHNLVILTTRDVEALESVLRTHWIGDVFKRYESERERFPSFYDFLYSNFGNHMDAEDTLIFAACDAALNEVGRTIHGVAE